MRREFLGMRLRDWFLVAAITVIAALVLSGCATPVPAGRLYVITRRVQAVTPDGGYVVMHEFTEETPERPADWDNPQVPMPFPMPQEPGPGLWH